MSQCHYVITVQWSASNGLNVATNSGLIPADGRTRAQMYDDIFASATRHLGAPPAYTSVLFFSLEPNQVQAA
ncbi:tautomerase family protein [Nocardia asiatica]|uniref:tautomerase family protein n=1 Tax=Nocardia asiatica TaxID=209252 RepID=UPI002458C5D8|nr:hypothetical protein [Nocardia asiatica]